jgi:FkbM family methyltransferase
LVESFLAKLSGLPKLRIFVRDLVYGVVEVACPHTAITLGDERFNVPFRWRKWFSEGYEQPTFDFIRAHCNPGGTLIDIGAHFGIFTITALRKVGPSGKVISFEPCAATRSVLLKTLALNGFDGIPDIRNEAVSNVTGESSFFSSPIPGDAANSLIGNSQHQTKSVVRTIRLDDIHLGGVDAIKIDAEGAELQILDGSRALITKHRPAVLLSVHPIQIHRSGRSLEDLWNLLESLKLVPYYKNNSVSFEWFRSQTELFDVCLEAHTRSEI